MERIVDTIDKTAPIIPVSSDGFYLLDPNLFGFKVILETTKIKVEIPTFLIEECLFHRESNLLAILVADKEEGERLFTFFIDQDNFTLTTHQKNITPQPPVFSPSTQQHLTKSVTVPAPNTLVS